MEYKDVLKHVEQRKDPICVHELAEELNMSMANAYYYMKTLRDEGDITACFMKAKCAHISYKHKFYNPTKMDTTIQKRDEKVKEMLNDEIETLKKENESIKKESAKVVKITTKQTNDNLGTLLRDNIRLQAQNELMKELLDKLISSGKMKSF